MPVPKAVKSLPLLASTTFAMPFVIWLASPMRSSSRATRFCRSTSAIPTSLIFRRLPHLIEAVYKAMRDGKNGYAPSSGIKQALDAIRGEAARKGITTVQDVFVTTGVSETVDLCLTALLNPGDDLLTPCPDYPLYSAVLAKLGIRLNAYYLNEEDGWQPDLDDIKKKITPRTRGIVLINPNNPTGSVCRGQCWNRLPNWRGGTTWSSLRTRSTTN